ncbi:MAG TPA: GNAT family N-acetyltransferase, partial [Clostridia bacterium]
SIASAFDPFIINGIGNGPTKEYYSERNRLDKLLDNLSLKATEILKENNFDALPKTRLNIRADVKNRSTALPHKTVATRAGIGWIGKCALLVTEQFGSAVRITSILTNAPLETSDPINGSSCGNCGNCVRNCPGKAISGDLWSSDMKREQFYNALSCRKTAVERSWNIAPGEANCGLCILVCPRTKKYIVSNAVDYGFPSVDIAAKGDLEEILDLQKLAYMSEAEVCGDYKIPPLIQNLSELIDEYNKSIVLKVMEDRKIVGSVRAFERDGTCYIGRLIVHPDYQNRGIGKKLLQSIEKCYKGLRYELFTGHKSEKNLSFYEKLGYKRFRTEPVNDKLQLVYLEKIKGG